MPATQRLLSLLPYIDVAHQLVLFYHHATALPCVSDVEGNIVLPEARGRNLCVGFRVWATFGWGSRTDAHHWPGSGTSKARNCNDLSVSGGP